MGDNSTENMNFVAGNEVLRLPYPPVEIESALRRKYMKICSFWLHRSIWPHEKEENNEEIPPEIKDFGSLGLATSVAERAKLRRAAVASQPTPTSKTKERRRMKDSYVAPIDYKKIFERFAGRKKRSERRAAVASRAPTAECKTKARREVQKREKPSKLLCLMRQIHEKIKLEEEPDEPLFTFQSPVFCRRKRGSLGGKSVASRLVPAATSTRGEETGHRRLRDSYKREVPTSSDSQNHTFHVENGRGMDVENQKANRERALERRHKEPRIHTNRGSFELGDMEVDMERLEYVIRPNGSSSY